MVLIFYALARSRHVSFSDFPVLPLVRRTAAVKIMDVINRLAGAFLNEELDRCLEGMHTREMEVETITVKGKPKRRLVGELGDVIIH